MVAILKVVMMLLDGYHGSNEDGADLLTIARSLVGHVYITTIVS